MKNLRTKKTSNGSNFGWLIQQMSIYQKKWAANVSWMVCIRLSFRFALPDRKLLQMTCLLNLCPSVLTDRGWGRWGPHVITDGTFITLGSSYYTCSLYTLTLESCTFYSFYIWQVVKHELGGCNLKGHEAEQVVFISLKASHSPNKTSSSSYIRRLVGHHIQQLQCPFQALRARRDQQRNNNIILFA